MRTVFKEMGIRLTPEFEDAADRMGDDVLKWLLLFAQLPLPPEQTPEWDHLLYELMLPLVSLNLESPKRARERRKWEGESTLVDFAKEGGGRCPQIPLPPAKEVKEIHATIGAWLHELMDKGAVVIKVSDISEISFKIKKNKYGSRKLSAQEGPIDIKGGYKGSFLLLAAEALTYEAQYLRSCPFPNCPAPIFAAHDKRQKYCTSEHETNATSRESYNRKSAERKVRALEKVEGSREWQIKQAHTMLFPPPALPSKPKANSRKNSSKQKKARIKSGEN